MGVICRRGNTQRGRLPGKWSDERLFARSSAGAPAVTLPRSRTTVATYRAAAERAARNQPEISVMVYAQLNSISAENGLEMARQRGYPPAQ
jgi:hypothetical protein